MNTRSTLRLPTGKRAVLLRTRRTEHASCAQVYPLNISTDLRNTRHVRQHVSSGILLHEQRQRNDDGLQDP
jgi:hypothetical protein